MKDFKGTPGPWKSWYEDVVIMESEESVTIVAACIDNENDVNLIAAAPDLLSALQKIVESGYILPHLKIESQWAIAKALGE